MIQQYILGQPIPEWDELDEWDSEKWWAMPCPGRPFFYMMQATDMVELVGEEEAVEMSKDPEKTVACEVNLVPHPRNLSPRELDNVLDQIEVRSIEHFHEQHGESYVWLAFEAMRYGYYAPILGSWGSDFEDARKAALDKFNPVQDILSILLDPVNKIGTPGLANMFGIVFRQENRRERTVQQDRLSEECWQVQTWGFVECLNCDFLWTEECGGREIWRTGRNSKGLWVPV